MTHRPLLITTGEPAGIGMDIVLQLAANGTLNRLCHLHNLPPFLVTACPTALQERQSQLIHTLDRPATWQVLSPNTDLNIEPVNGQNQPAHIDTDEHTQPDFLLLPIATAESVTAGVINTHNAAMVLEQLRLAHTLASQQKIAGIITAPLQKSALIDAKLTLPDGTLFSGHTEYFMQMNGIDGIHDKVVMMLANQKMKVALVTTHLPLHAVADAITPEQIRLTADIVLDSLTHQFGIARPRVLVCGLNPHAGEGGHLGKEETNIINPVLKELQQQGHDISLALPADTLFTQQYLQECDAVIAMYHDQGLPVLKSHGFGDSINITLGLPYVRTSVDHGTALDLAGTGQASASSLSQALVSAIEMTTQPTQYTQPQEHAMNPQTQPKEPTPHPHVNPDIKPNNPNSTGKLGSIDKLGSINKLCNAGNQPPAQKNPLATALTAFGEQVYARHASIRIDADALRHNLQHIKTLTKHAKVLAMVKADAYGHGVDICLPALTDADAVGVACLAEAMTCRQAGWDKPILLTEGAFSYDEWLLCQNQGMMCVIHQQRQLEWALSWADVHLLPRATNASHSHVNNSFTNNGNKTSHTVHEVRPIVWLKYNTGMNRLGFNRIETQAAAAQLYTAGFDVVLMSHFANADSFKHLNGPPNHPTTPLNKTTHISNVNGFADIHDNDINHSIDSQSSQPADTDACTDTSIDSDVLSNMATHLPTDARHDGWVNTKTQIRRFDDLLSTLKRIISPDIQGSLCNSAGIIRFADQHHDWVRLGILLYGSSPFADIDAESLGVRAVMTFASRIMAVHQLSAGDSVGYGSCWTAPHPCHVAVVSVGYGDGYPRVVDDTAHVSVRLPANLKHKHRYHRSHLDNDTLPEHLACPIVGRVAMDMLVIDVSHLATYFCGDKDVSADRLATDELAHTDLSELIGCDVILWGQPPNNPSIDAIASSANTISYELMCRLGSRPERLMR